MLPASPSDWLTADHQVYFLLDLVDELDLSAIVIPAQSKDPRGEKGFDPRMMTLLLLYAYCVGIVSSRKIERACYEDLAFRVLTGNQQPDHSRISEFRRRNLEALSELFVQILRLCQAAGMVSLGHVALDGTKVQANASKHKAMSHERMLKAEAQLEKEIKELMRRAEILDAQEDGKYGKGKLGSDLPNELRRREDRLKKIRQARQALEAEAAAAAARDRAKQAAEAEAAVADAAAAADAAVADASEQQKLAGKAAKAQEKAEAAKELAIEKAQEAGLEPEGLDPQPADAMPYRGLAHQADGSPTAAAQRNYTDPDSHIMKSDGNLLQGYNCQAAVDGDHQVIVAMGVSNQPPDPEHLVPMLERTMANTSQVPHRDGQAAARSAITTDLWPDPQRAGCQRQDGPQVAQEGRPGDLRQTKDNRGTSVWSDQRSARAAALPAARAGQGEWGMDALGNNPQPQQAVAPPEETEAAGGDGNGIGGQTPTAEQESANHVRNSTEDGKERSVELRWMG